MKHDPLCRAKNGDHGTCTECEIINAARADELQMRISIARARRNRAASVAEMFGHGVSDTDSTP